jgi:hypothetical protein
MSIVVLGRKHVNSIAADLQVFDSKLFADYALFGASSHSQHVSSLFFILGTLPPLFNNYCYFFARKLLLDLQIFVVNSKTTFD